MVALATITGASCDQRGSPARRRGFVEVRWIDNRENRHGNPSRPPRRSNQAVLNQAPLRMNAPVTWGLWQKKVCLNFLSSSSATFTMTSGQRFTSRSGGVDMWRTTALTDAR